MHFKLNCLLDRQEITSINDYVAVSISLYLLLLFCSNFSFTECMATVEMHQIRETLF